MSKERELLKALKDSVEQDPYNSAEVAKEATEQVATAGPSGASSSVADMDLAGALDFFNAMGSSMVDDPLFYVKLMGVVILGVIILLVAFELIVGS